ncbi:electron transport complex subunit RsxG [Candidatus Thiothrix sp. Deng01]|uniref:Ion-translocating oxidoreductase complex subunit G n=1 Tax=Candidatus Thiothrix phosphatis TaxID=3112415 RepID=A0ABU6CV86_9GAMM|nr:electron transport complex subunit RsxG [Candidatus Thiothrix sp. Deng01]MEB4589968.1 electron transport complex subunit RsxG [Candidatus Thiothrix sp. Deng01]
MSADATVKTGLDKWLDRIPYQAVLLGVCAAIAAALLVGVDNATREPIAQRKMEDLQASLEQVVPHELHDNNMVAKPLLLKDASGKDVNVYQGTKAGKVTALVWETVGIGYAGEIRTIIAVDPEGKILGTRVLAHKETPGLGDKIEAAKSDWISKFTGLSLGNPPEDQWKVKKDGGQFDQFSGATITPRGVVKSIREALQFFAAHKADMLEVKP